MELRALRKRTVSFCGKMSGSTRQGSRVTMSCLMLYYKLTLGLGGLTESWQKSVLRVIDYLRESPPPDGGALTEILDKRTVMWTVSKLRCQSP